MISHSVWRREKASDSAASHWPDGSETTAPRTISETLAMTGSARPRVAFIQSGKGIVTPATLNSKGSRNMQKNSSTSQGALRKNWVTSQEPARTGGSREICMSPSTAPAAVPIAMARKEIAMLKTKPSSSSGAQSRSEEHTSELQSLMRISYAVFCLKKKKKRKRLHW